MEQHTHFTWKISHQYTQGKIYTYQYHNKGIRHISNYIIHIFHFPIKGPLWPPLLKSPQHFLTMLIISHLQIPELYEEKYKSPDRIPNFHPDAGNHSLICLVS